MRHGPKALALVLFLAGAPEARAALISYEFSTTMAAIVPYDDPDGEGYDCTGNCQITGRIKFDSTAIGDRDIGFPGRRFVYQDLVPRLETFAFGVEHWMRIFTAPGHSDLITRRAGGASSVTVGGDGPAFWFYWDREGRTPLPASLGSLLSRRRWFDDAAGIAAFDTGFGHASGSIDYFRQVPEPATAALLLLGLAGVGMGRRRTATS
jgi:hypothetical protein